MPGLEQTVQQVLEFLSGVPRDDTGFGWSMGKPIAEATGLPPPDINDAVTLLVQSGAARWLQGLGSHPWHFTFVAITARGRALLQKAKTPSPASNHQAPVTVNINAGNFSGIAAGAVAGQTTIVSHQSSASFDAQSIRHALEELKRYKGEIGLAASEAELLDREIAIVDAELAVAAPNQSKIRAALKSMKELIEGGVKDGLKTVVASGIIHLLSGLL